MDIDVTPTKEDQPSQDEAPRTSDNRERLVGLAILVIALGGFLVWATLAPIDNAVVAPGVVAVESSRKTVQHLDGGVVREILVREGDQVKAGDLLLIIDDTEARAQFEIARGQYLALRADEARLLAERDRLDDVEFPDDLLAARGDPRADEAISGQQRVVEARRNAIEGEVDVLRQRIEQIGEQIVGLEALSESKQKRIELYQEEIDGLKDLFSKGMGDKSRLREWERLVAELEGELAQHRSDIAASKVQMGETRLQIVQVRRRVESEVAEQLQNALTELADVRERMRALENTLERTRVHAPVEGYVVGMEIHTIGGVLTPGSPILDISPRNEALIVEAKARPQDIDRLYPGLEAEMRFSAFNTRTTPTVLGRVLTVSGDSLMDPATNMPYFLVRIEVTPKAYEILEGLTLLPGMPADVMIKLGERTFFQYLVRPLQDRIAHAFTED